MTKQTRVRVIHDQDPPNPRTDQDNFGRMVCWHRRYNLGDVQPKDLTPQEYLDGLPKGSIVLPLFLFDHSGITMSTDKSRFQAWDSAGWDWGQVGFIYATPRQIRENYMINRITPEVRAKAEDLLVAEVEEYDTYLRGETYGFVIEEGEECSHGDIHWEQTDSCWGFLGNNPMINGMAEHVPEELHEQLKEAARSPVY